MLFSALSAGGGLCRLTILQSNCRVGVERFRPTTALLLLRRPTLAFSSTITTRNTKFASYHASPVPQSRQVPRQLQRRRQRPSAGGPAAFRRSQRLVPPQSCNYNHNNNNQIPCSVRDLDGTSLSTLGLQDHPVQALEEMLKRHIMRVDGVQYATACRTFEKIEQTNHAGEHWMALPFQMAICTCGAGVLLAFPLVFHLPTVEYVNEHFVTADHPLAKDLETPLEVGAWSWNWMVRSTMFSFWECIQQSVIVWLKTQRWNGGMFSRFVFSFNNFRNPSWEHPPLCSCAYNTWGKQTVSFVTICRQSWFFSFHV